MLTLPTTAIDLLAPVAAPVLPATGLGAVAPVAAATNDADVAFAALLQGLQATNAPAVMPRLGTPGAALPTTKPGFNQVPGLSRQIMVGLPPAPVQAALVDELKQLEAAGVPTALPLEALTPPVLATVYEALGLEPAAAQARATQVFDLIEQVKAQKPMITLALTVPALPTLPLPAASIVAAYHQANPTVPEVLTTLGLAQAPQPLAALEVMPAVGTSPVLASAVTMAPPRVDDGLELDVLATAAEIKPLLTELAPPAPLPVVAAPLVAPVNPLLAALARPVTGPATPVEAVPLLPEAGVTSTAYLPTENAAPVVPVVAAINAPTPMMAAPTVWQEALTRQLTQRPIPTLEAGVGPMGEKNSAGLLATPLAIEAPNPVASSTPAAWALAAQGDRVDLAQAARLSEVNSAGLGGWSGAATGVGADALLQPPLWSGLKTAAAQTTATPTPLLLPQQQVAVAMRHLGEVGGGQVKINLKPAALGAIEIQLEIQNNQVRGVIYLERPEVLHELARDLKGFTQVLTDAGWQVPENALSFSLQQQPRFGQGSAPEGESAPAIDAGVETATATGPAPWRRVDKMLDVEV